MAMEVLGLHFDGPYLRLALIESKRKKIHIRSLKSALTSAADDVKEIYISQWKGEFATGINALVRSLELKIPSIKQIEQGLAFQIESLTHVSIEDITYVPQIETGEGGSQVTLYIVPKQTLRDELEEWKKLSVEPDFVTANAQALAAFATYRCSNLTSAFLVDIGSEQWTCTWMEEGKIKKSFVIPHGVESLLSALWEDRKKVLFQKEVDGVAKQIDLLQLKQLLNPNLSERLDSLRRTLAGVLFSFQQVAGPRPVFFTGRINSFGRLAEYLLNTSPDLTLFEPSIPLSNDERTCAIPIGLALELCAKKLKPIQFLKGEFVPRKAWKRTGLWATGLALASLLCSASISFFGYHQIQQQKEEMVSSLRNIPDARLIRTALIGGIDQGIEQALSLINKHDKESPYLLQAPTVTEVLNWVSNHPLLQSFAKTGDPLNITEIRYQLVSMPRMRALKDPYTAQVTLEFQVSSPMTARKFHEALLTSDDWIDLDEEIAWESLSNSYRTTFTLKNRTPHVP